MRLLFFLTVMKSITKRKICLFLFTPVFETILADTPPSGYWTGDLNSSSTTVGVSVGEVASARNAGVTIEDLALLLDIAKGSRPAVPAADIDGDGKITKADIKALVEILLGTKTSQWRDLSIVVEGGGGVGNGGSAGENPPPVDSKKRNVNEL